MTAVNLLLPYTPLAFDIDKESLRYEVTGPCDIVRLRYHEAAGERKTM